MEKMKVMKEVKPENFAEEMRQKAEAAFEMAVKTALGFAIQKIESSATKGLFDCEIRVDSFRIAHAVAEKLKDKGFKSNTLERLSDKWELPKKYEHFVSISWRA